MIRDINAFIIRNFLKLIKTRDNYIVFESDIHHVFDNSFYLYKYLLQFRRLRLFYVVYSKDEYREAKRKKIKNTHILLISKRIYIHKLSNVIYILKSKIILKKCKISFITYRNFYKEFKIPFYENQIMVNLRHGQFPYKNVENYYRELCFEESNKKIYFRIGSNESLTLLPQNLLNLNCKWFASPMPRIDSVFEDKFSEFCNLVRVSEKDYSDYKYVLSLTTFRGNALAPYFETQFPIKLTKDEYVAFDDYLRKNKLILLIKIHHDNILNEDDYLLKSNNILILNDNDLEKKDMFVNNLFNYVHALLTDFSSAFFDFLYVNKPIGFVLTDYDDYYKNRGFTSPFENYVCGKKIYSLQDMYSFFDGVIKDNDFYESDRRNKALFFNGEYKSPFSKQIADFFINNKFLK